MIITDQSPFHFLAHLKGKKEIKCGLLSSSKLDKSIWVQTGYLSEVLQEIGESLTL